MSSQRVAVVTGGNKGIGLAIVRALCAKFNGDVYLTARNDNRGRAAVQVIKGEGLKVKYHQMDINDVQSVQWLKKHMVDQYGGIDVLVNNAGIAFEMADQPPPIATQAKLLLQTNFFGTLQTSNILLPHIKSNGKVVNMAGMICLSALKKCSKELQEVFRSDTITEEQVVARMKEFIADTEAGNHIEKGWPNTAYGVSKIGVTVMSRIHARQLREQGKNDILLNACCPGWVRTDMAGPKAPKSPDEGAETPVYLALLPEGATEPHGQYVSEKKVRRW